MTAAKSEKIRLVTKPPMIKKTYYVPVKLYAAVVEKTVEREENVADVIRRAFEQYVEEK